MNNFIKRLKETVVPQADETEPSHTQTTKKADQDVIFALGCKQVLVMDELVTTSGDGTFVVVGVNEIGNLYQVKRAKGQALKHLEHYFITVR